MSININGCLTQEKLEIAIKYIVQKGWKGREIIIPGTQKRWDMAFERNGQTIIVEYDGDEHYRNSLAIKSDREKDLIVKELGFSIVRIPYWVQLTNETFMHYFGFDPGTHIIQKFSHGFITTVFFPASYCEMGIDRFANELNSLPIGVKNNVINSLIRKSKIHGIEYVLPKQFQGLVWRIPSN
jgi:hypothetical protein